MMLIKLFSAKLRKNKKENPKIQQFDPYFIYRNVVLKF
jgi:hypothetical protein